MQEGYEVFFVDESGFILQNYKVKGWYQKGSQPVKQVIFDSRHKTYITGALSTKGFVIANQSDTINADNFLKFIKNLKERFSKIVLIIVIIIIPKNGFRYSILSNLSPQMEIW